MASNNLNKQMMWLITVISKQNLLHKDRDFIAELVSEEARKTIKSYGFILRHRNFNKQKTGQAKRAVTLHDIVESKRYSKILIEGTKTGLSNLLSVIKDNLTYDKITYAKYY